MKKIAAMFVSGLFLIALTARVVRAGDVELDKTSEVIKILKSHYVDHDKLDGKLLNEATVTGLLQSLGAGATVVTAGADKTEPPATADHLARAEVIDPGIGYIRVADVVGDTIPAFDAELTKFTKDKVIGYVLDLRYADGKDYEAAAALASRFLVNGQELFTIKSAPAVASALPRVRSLINTINGASLSPAFFGTVAICAVPA